jgi:hypothetical protein
MSMMNRWIRETVGVCGLMLLVISTGCSRQAMVKYCESWQDRLYAPTLLTRFGDTWFLVVCWQHRVLYHHTLDPDLSSWQTLDDELAGPHSLASDGHLYVVDDTGRHGLKVFTRDDQGFQLVQTITGLGRRTHRVHYDPDTQLFYVLASNSQEFFIFKRVGARLVLQDRRLLVFLEGNYTRSFSIHDGHLFFTSGPSAIWKIRHCDGSFEIVARYIVPEKLRDMIDLFHASDGWWYLTAFPRTMVRTRDLDGLAKGNYEDLYTRLNLQGSPYYLSEHNGRLWIPQIAEYSGVLSFRLDNGRLTDRRVLFDSGYPALIDHERRQQFPL